MEGPHGRLPWGPDTSHTEDDEKEEARLEGLAYCARKTGDLDVALGYYRELCDRFPHGKFGVTALYYIATALYKKCKFAEAIVYARRVMVAAANPFVKSLSAKKQGKRGNHDPLDPADDDDGDDPLDPAATALALQFGKQLKLPFQDKPLMKKLKRITLASHLVGLPGGPLGGTAGPGGDPPRLSGCAAPAGVESRLLPTKLSLGYRPGTMLQPPLLKQSLVEKNDRLETPTLNPKLAAEYRLGAALVAAKAHLILEEYSEAEWVCHRGLEMREKVEQVGLGKPLWG